MKISVREVTKEYATVTAVSALSLEANPGEILALLGPNGAGKSSLVRMIVGLTRPDSGQISFHQAGGEIEEIPMAQIGYLPEDRGLYRDRNLLDNLHYIAKLRGMDKAAASQSIDKWITRFNLSDRAKEPMRQLSKGNQQKVQVIATLLHDPQLVILDEPFSGLDPINQEFVLDILDELRALGATVLLSAHQMALVERLADKLVLMNLGKVVAQGSLEAVQQQLQSLSKLRVEFAHPVDANALTALDAINDSQWVNPHTAILSCARNSEKDKLLMQLMTLAPVLEFKRESISLHDLYLQAVRAQEANP